VLIFLASCQEAKKQKNKDEHQTGITQKQKKQELLSNYPELNISLEYLTDIYNDSHLFDDEISIFKVAYVPNENEMYSFLFYLEQKTDLKALENYNIGLILYPVDTDQLETESDREKGYAYKSVNSDNIFTDGENLIIVLSEFKLPPMYIQSAKSYLYYKGVGGVLNPGRPKLIIGEFPL
jgi:hypothetical protein